MDEEAISKETEDIFAMHAEEETTRIQKTPSKVVARSNCKWTDLNIALERRT